MCIRVGHTIVLRGHERIAADRPKPVHEYEGKYKEISDERHTFGMRVETSRPFPPLGD